jgi:hypothetical protein
LALEMEKVGHSNYRLAFCLKCYILDIDMHLHPVVLCHLFVCPFYPNLLRIGLAKTVIAGQTASYV